MKKIILSLVFICAFGTSFANNIEVDTKIGENNYSYEQFDNYSTSSSIMGISSYDPREMACRAMVSDTIVILSVLTNKSNQELADLEIEMLINCFMK